MDKVDEVQLRGREEDNGWIQVQKKKRRKKKDEEQVKVEVESTDLTVNNEAESSNILNTVSPYNLNKNRLN